MLKELLAAKERMNAQVAAQAGMNEP